MITDVLTTNKSLQFVVSRRLEAQPITNGDVTPAHICTVISSKLFSQNCRCRISISNALIESNSYFPVIGLHLLSGNSYFFWLVSILLNQRINQIKIRFSQNLF